MALQSNTVLIVGAGPVGLTLASELARHGVHARIVDRLEVPSPYCRAIGVTPRTLEVWDDMGIAREMIESGIWITGLRSVVEKQVHDVMLDLSDLPFSSLGLPQYETERILTRHLNRTGITIERGIALETLELLENSIRVQLVNKANERETATFRYVIGCDGARSSVRHALNIPFEGSTFPYKFMLADVKIDWDLPRGMSLRALRPISDAPPEMFIAVPLPEQDRYRVSMVAPPDSSNTDGPEHGIVSEVPAPGLEPFQAIADQLLPSRPILSDLRWSSVFRISMRLAARYRQGNVFLAGDAAHIHPPTGGQGMNTGIQDAYNLAWKLALVINAKSPDTILESYEAERRPVGEDVIARTTAASVQLGRERGGTDRLADTQILVHYRNSPWVQQSQGESLTGPQAGDRMPDCFGLCQPGIGFPIRLFDVLRGSEHVLFVSPQTESTSLDAIKNRLEAYTRSRVLRIVVIVRSNDPIVDHHGVLQIRDTASEFERQVGKNSAYWLVRPDGYIAWRGDSPGDLGLVRYLDRVFIVA